MSIRRDKRQNDGLREIRITFEGLARVDGSARFSYGDIAVLASVSGPVEVRLAAEQASQATFEVLTRPLSNVPSTESKLFSSAIRAALLPSLILNQHPRSLIQLSLQALNAMRSQWKDALIASMINAGMLALLNAGSIPMRGVVCAVAVGHLPRTGLVVDPSEEECMDMDAGGCFAFIFAEGVGNCVETVWTNWRSKSGNFAEKGFDEARTLAKIAAQNVYDVMKASIPWMGTAEPFELASSAIKTPGREREDDDKMEIWYVHVRHSYSISHEFCVTIELDMIHTIAVIRVPTGWLASSAACSVNVSVRFRHPSIPTCFSSAFAQFASTGLKQAHTVCSQAADRT